MQKNIMHYRPISVINCYQGSGKFYEKQPILSDSEFSVHCSHIYDANKSLLKYHCMCSIYCLKLSCKLSSSVEQEDF